MTRREAREIAFQIVFEKMFQHDIDIEEIIAVAKDAEIFEVDAFAQHLVQLVYENLSAVDELIDENLVRWSADRISKVSRAVLRLSVAEIKYTDIPAAVAVNEAVELTKKYSGKQDSSFVNGVLASVIKRVRQ